MNRFIGIALGVMIGLAVWGAMVWWAPTPTNLMITHIDREGRLISTSTFEFPSTQACDAAKAEAMGLYELASANGYRNGMKARCTP